MILRPLTLNDAPLIYRWRTDEESRRNSTTKHIFSGESHVGWLCEKLASRSVMLVGESYNEPVGAVYFIRHKTALDDKKTKFSDDYIVSIMIAPECRRMGYGKALLEAALRTIDLPCQAVILDDNIASRRIFEQCGFVKTEQNAMSSSYRWVPQAKAAA